MYTQSRYAELFAQLETEQKIAISSAKLEKEMAEFDPKNNLWDLACHHYGAYGSGRQHDDVYLSCESVGGILRQLEKFKYFDDLCDSHKKTIASLIEAYKNFKTEMMECKSPVSHDKEAVVLIWTQYYQDEENWTDFVPKDLDFADHHFLCEFEIEAILYVLYKKMQLLSWNLGMRRENGNKINFTMKVGESDIKVTTKFINSVQQFVDSLFNAFPSSPQKPAQYT